MMNQRDKFQIQEHFSLNEGAYFYRKGDLQVNAALIDETFKRVAGENTIYAFKNRLSFELEYSGVVYCSFLVYEKITPPSFLDFKEECPKQLLEKSLAYLILVEIAEFIVIVKRNVANLSSFLNSLQGIDGHTLGTALSREDSQFQKIKTTSMAMNKNAMRNKSYEANDLQKCLPEYAIDHSIIQNVRIQTEGELCTLNISTSRIAKFGAKKNMGNLLSWVDEVVHKLNNHNDQALSFFNKFSMPLSWINFQNRLTPVSLFINIFDLFDHIRTKLENNSIYYSADGEFFEDRTDTVVAILTHWSDCYSLSFSQGRTYTSKEHPTLSVQKNKLGMSVKSNSVLDHFYCHDGEQYVKLLEIVNRKGFFIVGFSEADYAYHQKKSTRQLTFLKGCLPFCLSSILVQNWSM